MKKIVLFLSIFITLTTIINSQTQVDFWLTLPDNVQLDCSRFIPDGNPPSGGWPCMIICHGYGLSKEDEMEWAESLAGDDNYYTIVYSMRGQGNSGGTSNLISTTEMNDLMQVINYVKNDNNTNDNRVGIAGGSQGGILPFMAACYGANVRCLITDLASPEFASSWIENGSIKMSLLWTVSYNTSIVRYNSTVGRFRSWILSSAHDKWDSLAYYMPLNRDFQNRINTSTVPMLISNAWQDKFFNLSGMINAAPNIQPVFRVYYGSMDGHGSDPSESEFDFQSELAYDWMEYWLKGVNNGVIDPPNKYTYASTTYPKVYNWWSFQRFASPTWPPSGVNNYKLYFWPDLSMRLEPYTGSTAWVSFLNDVRDPNLTMETAVNYEFTGNIFQSKFVKTTTDFITPTLLQDSRLVGIPKVKLFYSSDNDLPQYNFQIYEVRPNNSEKLVTRINWTDRHYQTNAVKQIMVNGWAHSHIFKQGNRIKIRVTNLDTDVYDDEFLRTNPYVLPVLKRATDKIYVNGSQQSYLELPLMGFAIGVNNISTEVPANFSLSQNYPNPFNPNTKIKFSLPSVGERHAFHTTKLIVYDILGREIKTLVNEELGPGTYEVDFSGANFPSGIYFYRLIAGDPSTGSGFSFNETKTMVLVK